MFSRVPSPRPGLAKSAVPIRQQPHGDAAAIDQRVDDDHRDRQAGGQANVLGRFEKLGGAIPKNGSRIGVVWESITRRLRWETKLLRSVSLLVELRNPHQTNTFDHRDFLTSPQRPVSIASSRRVSVWVTSSSVRKYSTSRPRSANSNSGRLPSVPSLLKLRTSALYSAKACFSSGNCPISQSTGDAAPTTL